MLGDGEETAGAGPAEVANTLPAVPGMIDTPLKTTNFEDEYVLDKARPLGTGINGVVFTCVHKETGEEYAVKFLPDGKPARNEARCHAVASRLPATAAHVAELAAVFINQGHGLDSVDKRDWLVLVMQRASGGELYTRLLEQPSRRFTEDSIKVIAKQLACALAALHRAGITHGDLKPENVMFTEDGRVTLVDFGFATTDRPEGHQCTVPYAAPELVKALVAYQLTARVMSHTHAADCWALGVVLFLCISGRMPFVDSRRKRSSNFVSNELRQIICTGRFAFDGPSWALVSDDAKDVIKALLTVDADDRMTAEQLVNHAWLLDVA